jgi:diacylglycerol kinase family enzyme
VRSYDYDIMTQHTMMNAPDQEKFLTDREQDVAAVSVHCLSSALTTDENRKVAPYAQVNDGKMDLVVVKGSGGREKKAMDAARRKRQKGDPNWYSNNPDVLYMKCDEIVIEHGMPDVDKDGDNSNCAWAWADGERM